MANHRVLLIALFVCSAISAATLFAAQSLYPIIILSLVLLSLNFRLFWLIVVPILSVQQGLEKTVFLNPDDSFISLFDVGFIPDLWLITFGLRTLIYLMITEERTVSKYGLLLFLYLGITLALGTFFFESSETSLDEVNKAPIKFLVFILLASATFYEVKSRSNKDDMVYGLVTICVVGAMSRVPLLFFAEVKDPGVYTFISMFFAASMLFKGRLYFRGVLSSKVFWFVVFVMHFSVSRTEIIMFAFSTFILLSGSKRISFSFVLWLPIIAIAIFSYVPESITDYLIHKGRFFALLFDETYSIGDSASVRLFTFFNLIFGDVGNIFNVIFGYGLSGYINFDAYYHPSILSEGAFSIEEISQNKFYHLHFFLNNILFYFGLTGLVLYMLVFGHFVRTREHSLELIIYGYAFLNVFFRQELILIVPPVIIATRYLLSRVEIAKTNR